MWTHDCPTWAHECNIATLTESPLQDLQAVMVGEGGDGLAYDASNMGPVLLLRICLCNRRKDWMPLPAETTESSS